VLDAQGLDDARMQAIARWTRLPETTFVFPPTQPGAAYRVRMFSPAPRGAFRRHPSVGTAHVVLDAGLAELVNGQICRKAWPALLPLAVRWQRRDANDRGAHAARPRGRVRRSGRCAPCRSATAGPVAGAAAGIDGRRNGAGGWPK
jgi:hypothetical protein